MVLECRRLQLVDFFSLSFTVFEASGQTLADSNISQITLPIDMDTLYNSWWYGASERSESPSITLLHIVLTLLSPGEMEWELTLRDR